MANSNKVLVILAFLGLLVSGYLFLTYTSPLPLICEEGGGCHEVQQSPFASHFGIPTPAYGIIYYLALGIFAALPTSKWWVKWGLIATTGSGFVVTIYLTYLEAFVIHAWCSWCITSAVLTVVAFFIVWIYPRGHGTHN